MRVRAHVQERAHVRASEYARAGRASACGKKKKIRAVDFVGTISKLEEVSADDIGIITIQENVSYVDILNGKGPYVLKEMRDTTVKGKQLKVHKANK